MKQKQLLKTLLAAVCLLVGTNAWGAATFWKVTSSTAVTANQTYVSTDYLTVASTSAGKLGGYSYTYTDIGSNVENSIQVRSAADPSSENLTGTDQSDCTRLVLTVTSDVNITFYYRRQGAGSSGSRTYTANDGKDLWVVNQTAPSTKLDGTLTAESACSSSDDYGYVKKAYTLAAGTYTVYAKGTTIQLNAISYERNPMYSVTYKANGGTGEDVVDDNASSVAANTFTYESHIFNGWNTLADGTGTEYEVGASVTSDLTLYAQWSEVTTQADIDFSNPITDGSVQGAVNSMVIGSTTNFSTEIAGDEGAKYLFLGDGTNTVIIPEAERAGNKDVVTIKFDMALADGSNNHAAFYIQDTEGANIGYMKCALWDAGSINDTNLGIAMNTTTFNKNGTNPKDALWSKRTSFTITLDYLNNTITTVSQIQGGAVLTPIVVSMTNKNPVAKFVVQAWPSDAAGGANRRAKFGNLLIKTIKGDYSVATAEYTVNWKVGDEIVKTDTRSGDVGSTISLLASDKEAFFNNGNTKKYSYLSDDSSEQTIADGGTTVVTVTCEEVGKFNYSVTTSAGSVIEEGTLYNDETKTISWSKYIEKDGIYYKATDPFQFTVSKDATSKEVSVTASQVTQFVEATSGNWSTTSVSDSKLSGGAAYRGVAANGTKTMLTVAETGYYSIEYAVFSTNTTGSFDFSLYKNDASVEENKLATLTVDYSVNYVITSGTKSVNNEYLQAGDKIIAKSGNTTCALDYIAIAKTGPTTISEYGYATFSSTYPVNVDVDGLEAYIVTGKNKNGSSITTQKVTGNVAANTGLILKGNAGTYSLPVVTSGTTYDKSSNPLNYLFACDGTRSTVDAAEEGTNYVLSVQNNKVVFAPIGETSAPIKKGQAALWLSEESGPAKALTLSFGDDVTGIDAVSTVEPQGAKTYYNLQGQRVSEPKQGIYVVDGKKVLVK